MPSDERRYQCRTVDQTLHLGEALGRLCVPGTVLDLRGPLGAGKTHFVRGLAAGLGVESGVRSPTFTICHVHEGSLPLFHIDAYRVDDPEELLIQGFDEMLDQGVIAVEWGARVAEILPSERLLLEFSVLAETEREIRISWPPGEFRVSAADLPDPSTVGE